MGFRLEIAGSESINLLEKAIETVEYSVDTPDDASSRSTDVSVGVVITGKIITSIGHSVADETGKIANWSLVPAESADSYRVLKVKVVTADTVVREVVLPEAFVVEYSEEFDEISGVGKFRLNARQKKDTAADFVYSGNFPL